LANPTARLEFKPGNIRLKYKCMLGCIMNTTFFTDGMATNLNYRSEKKLSVMKYRSVLVCEKHFRKLQRFLSSGI